MRTIKFRAKLTGKWNIQKAGEWIYFDLKMLDEKQSRLPIDWKTLSQFTGLKDRHGKEIYEGDIVRTNANRADTFEIIYEDSYARFALDNHFGDTYDMAQREFMGNQFEVIGNIYENPELLK